MGSPELNGGCGGQSLPHQQRSMLLRRTRLSKSLSIDNTEAKQHHLLNSNASAAILFKDSKGQPVVQPLNSNDAAVPEDDILNFFKCYKCYDLIPTSAKLVILDTELILKQAFFAMVDTGVRACPLWDSAKQKFVGMLTITDFIRILHQNYRGPDVEMEAFEEQRLAEWKRITEHNKDMISVPPSASLYDAVSLLIKNKIHRLPVVDPENGNVLYILNQKPLLRFLYHYVPNLAGSPHLGISIAEANVGSYNDIQTIVATETTTIIEALNKFVTHRISALPIVDGEGRLLSIYSKFDVINLAAEKTYDDLEVTLRDANSHKSGWFEGVHNCRGDESVLDVMERLVKADVNKLVVVDDEEKVVGIVTVSDIIHFLVLRHCPVATRVRRGATLEGRDNSIGEEDEEEFNKEGDDNNKLGNGINIAGKKGASQNISKSCSPPRWFDT